MNNNIYLVKARGTLLIMFLSVWKSKHLSNTNLDIAEK